MAIDRQGEFKDKDLLFAKTVQKIAAKGFSVVAELGTGSFGSVVELKHQETKERIALKLVLKNNVSKNEIELWAKLQHQNIVPLLLHKYEEPYHVFFMPKFGSTLSKMLHMKAFTIDPRSFQAALRWIRDVTSALSFLHGRDLCHLDVKTNNVLISNHDGRAVLADFGFIAKTDELVTRLVKLLLH